MRALYPNDHVPPSLDREFAAEDNVWNKLNTSDYEDSESDTDYSDKSDFTSHYGHWKGDIRISESSEDNSNDSMGDISDTNTETPMEVSESIEEKMNVVKL